MRLPTDAGRGSLRFEDTCPAGAKVRAVAIPGCAAAQGDGFELSVSHELDPTLDRHGVPRDAVWRLRTAGLPDRWVRLWNGHDSLRALLEKYSFFDANGCIYNADPQAITRGNADAVAQRLRAQGVVDSLLARRVPRKLLCPASTRRQELIPCHVAVADVGVAQLSERSGICWWGAMWFGLCFNRESHAAFVHYLDPKSPLRQVAEVLRSADASNRLRRFIFHELAIGDDPAQDPSLDGQNGYAQLSLLCSKLGVPLLTLMAPSLEEASIPIADANGTSVPPPRPPEPGQPALLGVRTYRATNFRPPLRLSHAGREWKLRSGLIGSEYCSHQIALSCSCGSQRKWAMYDSDGVRQCVGPVAWEAERELTDDEWWASLDQMIPVINKTKDAKFCDMNPRNNHPLHTVLKAYAAERIPLRVDTSETAHKLVNMDWIYTAVQDDARAQ